MAEVQEKDLTVYVDYLPQQFKDSVKLRTFLSIFLDQVQELEQANIELDNFSTNIDTAYGYQLDIIGKLIGVPRNGLTDEQYREAIYFQISLNIGNGTPEDCIQYLASVTKSTIINYWEHYPASIILETNGTVIPNNMAENVDNIALAGVSVGGVIVSETGEIFRGCEIDNAFENFVSIENPFPELELGGDNVECGNPLAECTYVSFEGFTPVSDTSDLARCILPEFNEVYTTFDVGAGEPLMEAGEPLALAADTFANPITTKGIFAEIYVK